LVFVFGSVEMKRIFLFGIALMTMVACDLRADEKNALDDLTTKAIAGDAGAQMTLAMDYRDGRVVRRDYSQAMRWAHMAADQGNASAMDFLGYSYLRGVGVHTNTKIAFGYFHAASRESAQGSFNLGQCYFGAQGIDQDIPKALDAWRHAAEMGHGYAAAEAAMVYLSGEGVTPDQAEALRLATRAAELGDPSGMVVLGEMQFQAGKIDEAKAHWLKASLTKPVGETGQPTQPSAYMSAQEGADLLKLLEYRERKSEPGKFAYVDGPHVHQGYNNCGATAATMLARFQGSKLGAWDFKRLCPSPVGTGTDWGDLMAAAQKIGLHWRLEKFSPDDAGFRQAEAFLRNELDSGRPVVIDFKFVGPEYPGGEAGHTLDVAGYLAAENLYILRNPAIASPGLELITAGDLEKYWKSDHYGALGHRILVRPAIVIDSPKAG
jgi:TPR repeat protein